MSACLNTASKTAIPNRDGEYKGAYYEIREVKFKTKNGNIYCTGYEERDRS